MKTRWPIYHIAHPSIICKHARLFYVKRSIKNDSTRLSWQCFSSWNCASRKISNHFSPAYLSYSLFERDNARAGTFVKLLIGCNAISIRLSGKIRSVALDLFFSLSTLESRFSIFARGQHGQGDRKIKFADFSAFTGWITDLYLIHFVPL